MTADERYTEIVPDALDGQRIDRVVALIADISRRQSGLLIAEGAVTVDDRGVDKPSTRVETGQVVRFSFATDDVELQPDASVEVPLVHFDDHVIVVDKPAGMVVHPGAGVTGGTMVHGLLARFPELRAVGEPERPGIVHRLDRGTSGLLMVARTAPAYEDLVAQLASRTVKRLYRCVVDGHVEADGGLIDAPLGRSPRQATLRAVVADGRPARTRYQVRRRGDVAGIGLVTELDCQLETGRTHQIRAHLAAIGHPVLGDVDYGGSVVGGAGRTGRPFLHAEQLGFAHPHDGSEHNFRVDPPADFRNLLAVMRIDAT